MAKYRDYGTERQREEYGGINWGAAFFGWLVAVGLGALLTAFLGAAGTTLAISEIESTGEAVASADTVGIVGGILILLVALISYFAGGYVAGRMSRFDGARQGLSVWIVSIAVVVLLALIGVIAGGEYNLFSGLELPRIPVDEGSLTVGGVIVLILVLIGTLLAATAGGKAGERYHRKVDELGHRPIGARDHDHDDDRVGDRDRVDDRDTAAEARERRRLERERR